MITSAPMDAPDAALLQKTGGGEGESAPVLLLGWVDGGGEAAEAAGRQDSSALLPVRNGPIDHGADAAGEDIGAAAGAAVVPMSWPAVTRVELPQPLPVHLLPFGQVRPFLEDYLCSPLGWAAESRDARAHKRKGRTLVDTIGCVVRQCEFAVSAGVVAQPCLAWVLNQETCKVVLECCRLRKRKLPHEDDSVGDARLYQYAQSAYKALLFLLSTDRRLVCADAIDARRYLTTVMHAVRSAEFSVQWDA